MKNIRHIPVSRILILLLVLGALLGYSVVQAAPHAAAPLAAPQQSGTQFHFEFAADSRGGYSVLAAESRQMVKHNPVFAVFGGDLCGSFSTTCINGTWKPAMNGSNSDGMLAKTFTLRGNHDTGSLSGWQGLWAFSSTASKIGATHYTALTSDATYSFDYGNSHFVILDSPTGINSLTSSEISWLDKDLTAAESRGKVHEFLFDHGPVYGVTAEHGSQVPSSAMKAVLNKHRISATFAGHEHVTQYTHVTPSVESGINLIDEFTMGRAGAPAYTVTKHTTWHSNTNAFVDIYVNGSSYTATVYSSSGAVLYTKTISR
jgi:hypothetical protein